MSSVETASETDALLQSPVRPAAAQKHIVITISAIALGSFLAAFDLTIIASIYPSIGTTFNALNQTSYIATAYLLANTALQPLYGRLSDIYGRKQALLFANIVFVIGTAGCSLAPNLWSLVVARGIAGLGGGGLNVVGVVIMSDLVPLRSRGIYQGIMNIVFGCGSALGAPIGGLLADSVGWRWGFGIQIPFCCISLFMVYNFINLPTVQASAANTNESKLKRVDFLGSASLVSAVACLILSLNLGGNLVPWLSSIPLGLMAAFVILTASFVYIETCHAREPIMPMSLMTRRTPLLTALTNFFATAGYFVIIFNLPLFYRAVMNLGAADAGKRLIPGAVGGSIGSLGLGLLMAKTGKYWWFLVASASLVIACTVLIRTLGIDSSLAKQFLYLIPGGLGYGGLLTTTLVALLSSVSSEEMASATGTSYLFRSTGSIVGISVSANILNALLALRLQRYLEPDAVIAIKRDVNAIWKLPDIVRSKVLATYVSCMHDVFLFSIILAVVALIIGTGIEENKLHARRPGEESRASDQS